LPEQLPTPPTPVAAPVVDGAGVAALFTSFLYRAASGSLVVRDYSEGDWAAGLWFRSLSGGIPVLLAAPEGGMVVPLALSPRADAAAVWWLPVRRGPTEQPCPGGIYLLTIDGHSSRLVTSGDWSIEADGQTATWVDPSPEGQGRAYRLPDASFSADGRFLALIEPERIRIFGPDPQSAPLEHVGSCTSTAWARGKDVFAAGCDDTTSAWWVGPNGDGLFAFSVALTFPTGTGATWGWDASWTRGLAVTGGGDIRVARFFGIATGCETRGCAMPPLGYAVTTLDPDTGHLATRSATVKFIAEAPPRFSADASWLYVDVLDGAARVLDLARGAFIRTSRLGDAVGASLDGRRLFGRQLDESRGVVTVDALDLAGRHHRVLTVRWPAGAEPADPLIWTIGLRVATPS
jgi:hypothetical protein